MTNFAYSHKQTGYIFVAAMIIMAIPGGIVSYTTGKPFDVLSSVLTAYMVLTGWLAFKQTTIAVSIGLMCLAGLCFLGYVAVELNGVTSGIRATDAPTGAGYIFATILGLALMGDLKALRKPYPLNS